MYNSIERVPLCGRRTRLPSIIGTLSAGIIVGGILLMSCPSASARTAAISPMSPLGHDFKRLANEGVIVSGSYTGEFASNPVGGEEQGAAYAGSLGVGALLNLQRLVGWHGALFHVRLTSRTGHALSSEYVNNSVGFQEKYGGGETYQLTQLTIEQELFHKTVNIEIGRTALPDSFFVSPLYCYFQANAFCGNPSAIGKMTSTTFYPEAVWGGRLRVQLMHQLYIKLGAYQSAPFLQPAQSHGFNWRIAGSNGVLVPIEFGYRHPNPGGGIADRYDIGAIFDRTSFVAQTPFGVGYNDPISQFGRVAMYAQAQQQVLRWGASGSRGMYVFGAAMVGASGQKQVANYEFEIGTVMKGPFPQRPHDSAGFVISDLHYNSNYINSLFSTRRSEGGSVRPHNDMIMMELNYNIAVNSWLHVNPNVQALIHPDGLASSAYPTSNLPDAMILGLQFIVNIPQILSRG